MARTPKKTLTAKQQRFLHEFPKDLNATRAAIRAGYKKHSAKVTGAKLVKMIRDHVTETQPEANLVANHSALLTTSVSDQTQTEFQCFLTRLEQLAYFDVRKMFDQHNNAIDIPNLPDDVAPAVAGFEITEEFEGRGANRKSIGFTKKVKLVDRLAAQQVLAKVRGFFHDKDERPQDLLEKVPTAVLLKMLATIEAQMQAESAGVPPPRTVDRN
ncbi:MAG TPA: terminase small subunit [Nitrospiraceae bacterium]|nr:terminase small subunit [Nitrospiraceae bacterium]